MTMTTHEEAEIILRTDLSEEMLAYEKKMQRLKDLGGNVVTAAAERYDRVQNAISHLAMRAMTMAGEPGITFMTKYSVEGRGFWIASAEAYNTHKQSSIR